MSDQYYNINCINCTNCTSCTNCIDCDYCERCNYAANCTSCTDFVVLDTQINDGVYVFSNCNDCTELGVVSDEPISSTIVFNNSGCSGCSANPDYLQYGGIQNCINCEYSTNILNCNNVQNSQDCYYSSNCQNIAYCDHCLNATNLLYSIYCQSLQDGYFIDGNSHKSIGYINSQEANVTLTSNYCSQEIYSVQNYAIGDNVIINPNIQFTSYSNIIFSGNLPANLTINNETGVITGEYAINESYTGNVTVNFDESYTTPLVINYAADGDGNIRCSNCSNCVGCYECENCKDCTACSNCTSCENMTSSINCNNSKNGTYFDSCDNCDGHSHQYATGCKYCRITGNNTIGIIGTEEEPITTSAPDLCSDTIYNNSVVTNSNFSIIPNLAFTPNTFISFSDNLNTINTDSVTGVVKGTTSFTDVSSYIYITTPQTTLSTPIVINLGDENGNVRCSNCSDCMNCYECVNCRYCNYCSNCTDSWYSYGCENCINIRSEGAFPTDRNDFYLFSNCKNCSNNIVVNYDAEYTGEPLFCNNVDCTYNQVHLYDGKLNRIINCIHCDYCLETLINCNNCDSCINGYYSSNCSYIDGYCDHCINCWGGKDVYLIDCKNVNVQRDFYGLYLQNDDEVRYSSGTTQIGDNIYSDYTYDKTSGVAGWNNVNITPNMQFTSYSGLVFSAANLPTTLNIDANTGSLTGTIATTYNTNVSIIYNSQTFSTPLVMNVIETDENGNIRCSNCTDCYSCYECVGCQNCIDCTDCKSCIDCESCIDCISCNYCTETSNSNQCVSCTNCLASSFSWRCVNCINCPYCTNCTDCTDCFILINCDDCTNCRFCVDLTDGNNQTKVNWS